MGAYVECELAGDHPNNDACAFESPPCPFHQWVRLAGEGPGDEASMTLPRTDWRWAP